MRFGRGKTPTQPLFKGGKRLWSCRMHRTVPGCNLSTMDRQLSKSLPAPQCRWAECANSTHEQAAWRKGVNRFLAPCENESSAYGVNRNLAAHTPGLLTQNPNHTSERAEVTQPHNRSQKRTNQPTRAEIMGSGSLPGLGISVENAWHKSVSRRCGTVGWQRKVWIVPPPSSVYF